MEEKARVSRTGRAASSLLPLWTLSLGWELRRGRQVVVTGEVNDRFWLEGAPASFRELLVAYLLTTGAEIIGWWDPVDGLTFPIEGHEELFRRASSDVCRPPTLPAARRTPRIPAPKARTPTGLAPGRLG